MNVEKLKSKKYELVAPDGGWGYLISLAVIINLTCTTTFMSCFGIIFKELLAELKMDSTNIMLFNGISALSAAVAGFFSAPLLKYMSLRQLGIVAALIFNAGVFATVFVKSKIYFFITQGVMQYFGCGIIFNVSTAILTSYFVKRRLLAVSFTQTIVAICAFFSPHFVKWSLESYGFRGTLLLISGISLQSIFAMVLMQPVSWHMKRIEVPADNENEKMTLLLTDTIYVNNKDDLTTSLKSASLHSHSILEHAAERPDEKYDTDVVNHVNHNSNVMNYISNFIDVPLYKTFLFSNASVGVALSVFSEITFMIMVPQALYFMAWSESEVAWAMSLNALGDLVTRTLFIFMSGTLAKFGNHEIYVAGLVIAFTSRLGMLWSDNRISMVTCLTIMGVSRCTILLLLPIVIADAVKPDKFASALSLWSLLTGIFNLTLGPVVGIVRDLTDSYTTAFYILTSFFAIVAMFWSIELLYKKNKHKRLVDTTTKP